MTSLFSFAQDVFKGLSSTPKFLHSKYFYDEKGDKLFQAIMDLEEYYLTRAEFEILHQNRGNFLEFFCADPRSLNLIELGAGDGQKIKGLLETFLKKEINFTYVPIDISAHALSTLSENLRSAMPQLKVKGICGDYFEALRKLPKTSQRNVVLFLGSNIGNLTDEETYCFLAQIRSSLNAGDLLMIGFDLKKDPDLILKAYRDSRGITRDFNLNLLERINTELEADFDLDQFFHYAAYDPQTALAQSYVVSARAQTVKIPKLKTSFRFEAWEPIHTEISRKYDIAQIEELALQSGFTVLTHLCDRQQFFVDSIWMVP